MFWCKILSSPKKTIKITWAKVKKERLRGRVSASYLCTIGYKASKITMNWLKPY